MLKSPTLIIVSELSTKSDEKSEKSNSVRLRWTIDDYK